MRKAFTAPTVHFKGSGWAKKDRGAAASTKAAARSGGTDGDTGSTKHEGDRGEPKPTSDKNPGDKAASDSGSSDSGSSATESKSPTPKTPAGAD
jgi:hypothetical protein